MILIWYLSDMKLITRDTDYAVRAMTFMAGKRAGVISVSEMVKELKIPRPFLRKILQILNRKGLLDSHRGKCGGFTLTAPPEKIFLVDLIEAFQGPLTLNECFFKKRICPNRNICILKKKIDTIERDVIVRLKTITIKDLLRGD